MKLLVSGSALLGDRRSFRLAGRAGEQSQASAMPANRSTGGRAFQTSPGTQGQPLVGFQDTLASKPTRSPAHDLQVP